jgi:hypothetical protein
MNTTIKKRGGTVLQGVEFLEPHSIKGKGVGPEAVICIDLANWLRIETLAGRLRAVWFHVPNEGRRSWRQGRIMRCMGLVPGAPDYVFLGKTDTLAIEVKTKSGKLSENQKVFREWCETLAIKYVVCRSVEECQEIIKKTAGLWESGRVDE